MIVRRGGDFTHFRNRDDRMRECCAGAHFRRHPDRFHQLLMRSAFAQRGARVAANAIRALRDVRDGDGNDVLGLGGEGAIGEDRLPELVECRCGAGRELAPRFG